MRHTNCVPISSKFSLLFWVAVVAMLIFPIPTSCGHDFGTTLPETSTRSYGSGPPVHVQDRALLDFVTAWDATFAGVDEYTVIPGSFLPNLVVVWRSVETYKYRGLIVYGHTSSSREVVVANRGGAALGATAFFHELVHAALMATTYPTGDPDHSGPEYAGWTSDHDVLIDELQERYVSRTCRALPLPRALSMSLSEGTLCTG